MMAIFDRNGKTVGWLHNGIIFDRDHRHRAFLQGSSVFDYQGRYLGKFDRNYFRDQHGCAVAYVEGAEGEPTVPIPEIASPPRSLPIPPPTFQPSASPVPSISVPAWSNVDWDGFLA